MWGSFKDLNGEDDSSRPRIEDNLGIYSDEEEQPSMLSARSQNGQATELERTLVAENGTNPGLFRNVDPADTNDDLIPLQVGSIKT